MTSMHGYMDGSYDYKQMYDIKDLKGKLPLPVINENTLLGALVSNPRCSEFTQLVKSIPDIAAKFNGIQSDFTLFVPLSLDFTTLESDSYKVRQFLFLHMLEHAVPYQFLSTTRMMYLTSRLCGTRILVENLTTPNPLLNKTSMIVGQQLVGNAVIYFIDKPLRLDGNPNI
jgi:uncharacterized surface protein with fasciclin (FAS1) repeats